MIGVAARRALWRLASPLARPGPRCSSVEAGVPGEAHLGAEVAVARAALFAHPARDRGVDRHPAAGGEQFGQVGAQLVVRHAGHRHRLGIVLVAAGQGHAATVKFLLSVGADPKLADNRGKTALDIADEAGHLDAKNSLMTP